MALYGQQLPMLADRPCIMWSLIVKDDIVRYQVPIFGARHCRIWTHLLTIACWPPMQNVATFDHQCPRWKTYINGCWPPMQTLAIVANNGLIDNSYKWLLPAPARYNKGLFYLSIIVSWFHSVFYEHKVSIVIIITHDTVLWIFCLILFRQIIFLFCDRSLYIRLWNSSSWGLPLCYVIILAQDSLDQCGFKSCVAEFDTPSLSPLDKKNWHFRKY